MHEHDPLASDTISAERAAPYAGLDPDTMLDAIESVGLRPSGGLLALNSYENRVYQIEMESGEFLVGKFYRPERWSSAAIREEHAFSAELADAEISVVAPLPIDGETLFEYRAYQFALFKRQGGHPPNLEDQDDLEVLARTLARIHAIGATRPFAHRRSFSATHLGHESRSFLLASPFIPMEMSSAYETTTAYLLEAIEGALQDLDSQRIHGDCHMGNVLWREDTPHFVDFDDCLSGPVVQDIWMLLSGERAERTAQLCTILDAYFEFHDFPLHSLRAIEALRTLRIMHHAAWIARRWHDPAFPMAFPQFDTPRYWSDHLLTLREQQAALEEPALTYM
ncbi:MAG: serine/threonine protein kinase [Pseudomonadota bacterium]